jgi:hypothetical protein
MTDRKNGKRARCAVIVEIGHANSFYPGSPEDFAEFFKKCKYGAVGCYGMTDDLNSSFIDKGVGIPGMPRMIERDWFDHVGPGFVPFGDDPVNDGGNGKYKNSTEGLNQMLIDIEARAIEAAKTLCNCCKTTEVEFFCDDTLKDEHGETVKDIMENFGLKRWCHKNFTVPCK